MVKVREDLTGKIFGRWTVLYQAEDKISKSGALSAMWHCRCSCEKHTERNVAGRDLKHGISNSCGCLKRDLAKERYSKVNTYDLSGDYGIGYCTNTGREFYFDLEDYDKIKDYCWIDVSAGQNYRRPEATLRESGEHLKMWHLLGFKGFDHIDRNPFNNRKNNFRKATPQENARNISLQKNNTSGITGVTYDKSRNKWQARIKIDYKYKHLGRFENKEDAIIARLKAEKEYFGEFAPQKHLYEKYGIE